MADVLAGIAYSLAHFLRVLLFLTRPVSDIVLNFLYRLFMGETKPLPPIENKILLMPAVELADKIRKRQLRCEDVMQAYIERCRMVHPFINAVVDARYEDALNDAKRVDILLNRGEKTTEEIKISTPLLGVPFTCKEFIGIKDLAQTAGVVAFKNRVAEEDSDAAALYRAAGAIPVTVTNVPELSMWWESSNLVFGVTKNPFDNSRTIGGSTGGESALLTSAGAVIGIGSDIGGSIRIPSSFGGIYGHKPSPGVVSNKGKFSLNEDNYKKTEKFSCIGPMCRYAEDLPLLLQILSGDDKRLKLQHKVDFQKVKIYYLEEIPGKYLASVPAIRKSIRKAVSHLESEFGVKAIPLNISELEYAMSISMCKVSETGLPPFKTELAAISGNICLAWELLKSLFRTSNHTFPAIYYALINKSKRDQLYYTSLKRYDELERKFEEIFREDSILLIPTHPELPPHRHMTIPKFPNVVYTLIFNILGYPATNIPAGLSGGVPYGIQAVSGRFKDHLTIAAAIELDKLFGGWKCPCEIKVK